MDKPTLEDIVSLAKRRGFIYQGSEIYGGLAGVYDYGPLGVAVKRHISNLWWKRVVDERDNIYGLDSAILMSPQVWEASGHVAGFTDPLVECKKCHQRNRADHVEEAKLRVGGTTDDWLHASAEDKKLLLCPSGEPHEYTGARQFNMMLKSHIGASADTEKDIYLRPETAQGIFVDYKNVLDSFNPKLPFGIAQIGKAFRNEISPRDFIFRLRELEQMEMQYFIAEEDQEKFYQYWRDFAWGFLTKDLEINEKKLRWHEHGDNERAHYAAAAHDIEFDFPFGFKELWGTHNRTDYDLSRHAEESGKDLQYFDQESGKHFTPYVIESSVGLDRMILAVLTSAYSTDEQGGEKRVFLKLPANLAPVKVAVFPLLKNKPELVKKAREIYQMLQKEVQGKVMWDDNGNIGKRYRRQDEIGTPYCVTIDFDTLADSPEHQTVTVRDRDNTNQDRIHINALLDYLKF